MKLHYTADEHYFHERIIRPDYANRPFADLREMHTVMIGRHNERVSSKDTTIHAGDFSFGSQGQTLDLLKALNGYHIMLLGSHDYPIHKIVKKSQYAQINYGLFFYRGRVFETAIKNNPVVINHYCMRAWAKSHYNSWHLFGHAHGRLEPIGKSWDIGVDNNDFCPVSEEEIIEIMKRRPDNPNLVKKR